MNFSNITRDRPELEEVASRVKNWLDSHRSVVAIDPLRIVREKKLPLSDVAELFRELEERGMIKGAFRLKDVNGTYVGGPFDSPGDIPEEVKDHFGGLHRRDDCHIAVVFTVK